MFLWENQQANQPYPDQATFLVRIAASEASLWMKVARNAAAIPFPVRCSTPLDHPSAKIAYGCRCARRDGRVCRSPTSNNIYPKEIRGSQLRKTCFLQKRTQTATFVCNYSICAVYPFGDFRSWFAKSGHQVQSVCRSQSQLWYFLSAQNFKSFFSLKLPKRWHKKKFQVKTYTSMWLGKNNMLLVLDTYACGRCERQKLNWKYAHKICSLSRTL